MGWGSSTKYEDDNVARRRRNVSSPLSPWWRCIHIVVPKHVTRSNDRVFDWIFSTKEDEDASNVSNSIFLKRDFALWIRFLSTSTPYPNAFWSSWRMLEKISLVRSPALHPTSCMSMLLFFSYDFRVKNVRGIETVLLVHIYFASFL